MFILLTILLGRLVYSLSLASLEEGTSGTTVLASFLKSLEYTLSTTVPKCGSDGVRPSRQVMTMPAEPECLLYTASLGL